MNTRRDFLKMLSLGTLLPLSSLKAFGSTFDNKKRLGAQIYSFRDLIHSDLWGTIEAIGRMGFTGLEPYVYDGKFFGIEAREFRKRCADLGLEIYGTTQESTNPMQFSIASRPLKLAWNSLFCRR